VKQPDELIRDHLQRVLAGRSVIVLCGREDDAVAWQRLLGERPDRCLTIALDAAARRHCDHRAAGATGHLAWHHDIIAGLDGSGWLSQAADAFDPDRGAALVLPDPLDPPAAGTRSRIGRRPSGWRLLEDKTLVDTVWDLLAVHRAPSIVADVTDIAADVEALGALVDQGAGVVCSSQSAGTPMAGADGVCWWRRGQPPRLPNRQLAGRVRVRLMPLFEGLPVRLHGLVMPTSVVGFQPMEVVALPRTEHGTFLCAGAVPTLEESEALTRRTERIGVALRRQLGYLGAFSVDGVITEDGFMPTDLNARLTSAIEDRPSDLRVLLQATNLLVREGVEPGSDVVRKLSDMIFTRKAKHTVYGAAATSSVDAPCSVDVRWSGDDFVTAHDGEADGTLTLSPSLRGWQLTARLVVDRLPTGGPMGPLAVELFRFCDRNWGTDFGELEPPFGNAALQTHAARAPTTAGGVAGAGPASLSPGDCNDVAESLRNPQPRAALEVLNLSD